MLEPAPRCGAVGLGVPGGGHSRGSSAGTCLRGGCCLAHVHPSVCLSVWGRGRAGGDGDACRKSAGAQPAHPPALVQGGLAPTSHPEGAGSPGVVPRARCWHLGVAHGHRAGALASFCAPKSPRGWRGAGLGLAPQLLLCPSWGLGSRVGTLPGTSPLLPSPQRGWRKAGGAK